MIRKFFNTDANEPASGEIPKEKAQDFIKQAISQVPKDSLGRNPGDTLAGAIIETKFSTEVHDKLRAFRRIFHSFQITVDYWTYANDHKMKTRETAMAVTNFQIARQMAGRILAERGAGNPYPKEGGAAMQDQGEILGHTEIFATNKDHVIMMRDKVEEQIIEWAIYVENTGFTSWTETVCTATVMQELLKGKMILGELLAKMD